jgi:Ca-activated chloride channel family protein
MKLAQLAWIWPQMLWLLCLLPLVFWIYLRRRRRGSIETVNTWLAVAMKDHRWAHAPAVFLLLGLATLILSSARPQAVLMTPQRVDALMLVLDISGSMRADDVLPSRIDAAKDAIRRFISKQPVSMKVGLVTVAATATVVQMPTTNRDALLTALDGVALQPGSALGAGIAVALSGLLPPGSVPLQSILDGTFQKLAPSTGGVGEPLGDTERGVGAALGRVVDIPIHALSQKLGRDLDSDNRTHLQPRFSL